VRYKQNYNVVTKMSVDHFLRQNCETSTCSILERLKSIKSFILFVVNNGHGCSNLKFPTSVHIFVLEKTPPLFSKTYIRESQGFHQIEIRLAKNIKIINVRVNMKSEFWILTLIYLRLHNVKTMKNNWESVLCTFEKRNNNNWHRQR